VTGKKTKTQQFDVIVLGAGAAGLMCAAIAGQRGRTVLLVDHADEPGKKILISGGGRCNFTNLNTPAECYISENPHFAKSALKRYPPADFIALIERHNIAWHEKTLGQLFCDEPARQIVAMLRDECTRGGVKLAFGHSIGALDHADGYFNLRLAQGDVRAPALVLATGGLSIPKMGATGFAYDVARRFGLDVIAPRPALVPLTLSGEDALFRSLSGVASEVIAQSNGVAFREAALFTHKGLSGPAILQVSSYWTPGGEIGIDFFPGHENGWLVAAKRAHPRSHLRAALAVGLPARLADALAGRIGVVGELANIPDRKLQTLETRLNNWTMTPSGSEGFAKAEVTAGGIDTAGLSSRTMQAKKVPGLFTIGEAVDVTGWLGGYNFQWAWASGWAAAQAL
jgi:predicted Rossmann fold flavoprotein